jgi:glucose/arabinose dehydrogenase
MHWRGLSIGAALCAAAAVILAQNPQLPPPYASKSVNNGPRVIPQPNSAKLSVPAGFHVDVWAEDFNVPRFMILGPGNEILLSDSGNAPKGCVYVFPPGSNERRKIIDGLQQPFGLAMLNGYLYVAENDSVKRYKYDQKAMTAASPGEEVVSLKGQGTHHWTRSLLFDRANKYLYVGVGSGSNSWPGEDPRRAAISRYSVDGWKHEIFASGLRNPVSLLWYPGTDTLWTGVQERDTLGDDLVPDYFTHVQQGAFYGWPFAYIGPHEDPMNKGAAPDMVAKTIAPDVQLGAHVAVLDFIFYTGKQFPAQYQGGAFLCFHGSWNRSMRVGQSVVFIPFKDGKPAGPITEIVKGWMLGPDKREVWGRPVGLLQMPDGSLLISEDGNSKIWHLTYTGK